MPHRKYSITSSPVCKFTHVSLQVKDQNLQKQYPWRFRFKVKLYPEDVAYNIIQDVTLVSSLSLSWQACWWVLYFRPLITVCCNCVRRSPNSPNFGRPKIAFLFSHIIWLVYLLYDAHDLLKNLSSVECSLYWFYKSHAATFITAVPFKLICHKQIGYVVKSKLPY